MTVDQLAVHSTARNACLARYHILKHEAACILNSYSQQLLHCQMRALWLSTPDWRSR